jgi:phage terminase large subunit GpA-like protein
MVVASVDTQEDRLEIKVKGYSHQYESWLLHYEKIFGDTMQHEVWQELDERFDLKFEREDGVVLKIIGAFVDSGGSRTQMVYDYCLRRQHRNIVAIKGIGGMDKPLLLNTSKVGKDRRTVLQNIGVDAGKSMVMRAITTTIERTHLKEINANHMHFPAAICDIDYFKVLTTERAQKVPDRKFGIKIIWKKKSIRVRNEPLDLEVYCLARAKAFNPNFEAIEKNINIKKEQQQPEIKHELKQPTPAPLRRTNLNIKPKNNFATGWK